MLFSHGVRSIGLAEIEQWNRCLSQARKRGFYIGVDTRAYPQDFATFVDYSRDLERHFGHINLTIPLLPYKKARELFFSHRAITAVCHGTLYLREFLKLPELAIRSSMPATSASDRSRHCS